MLNNAASTNSLRLKPLVACLAVAMAVGAAGSASIQAAPAHANSRPHLVKRTGDGFLRIQAARLEQGRSHRAEVAPRPAATVAVTTCADDGSPGTLRSAVTNAVDGDVIDLTSLACSTITLASGGISVDVDDLSIVGPGATALTIDAAGGGTAFDFFGDAGYGTLSVSGVTMTNGYYYGAGGGGIWAGNGGSVTLTDSAITNSMSAGKYASGGGIFADGNVTLVNSTVSNSTADSSKYEGIGGGVYAAGDVSITNSTISGNVAKSNGTYYYGGYYGAGLGGGIAAAGTITVTNSTLSGNSASYGGAVFSNGLVTLQNSTVTANLADAANSSGSYGAEGGGVAIYSSGGGGISLNSTIAFGNIGGGAVYGDDLGGNVSISGANNLVGVSTIPLPGDTLASDPLLGPLANNGGPTLTHAIPAGSPAADAGNNAAGLTTDQRGAGFPRVSGAAADIGSFEIQGTTGGPPDPYSYLPVPAVSNWALALMAGLLGLFGWRNGQRRVKAGK